MAKISTLMAMSLVLRLAMSVRTWADESWAKRGLGMQQKDEADPVGKEQQKAIDVKKLLEDAHKAIEEKQKEKAEESLTSAYKILQDEESGDERVTKFVQAVEETEMHVKQGEMDKAQQVLEAAMREATKTVEHGHEITKAKDGDDIEQKLLDALVHLRDLLEQAWKEIKENQKENAEKSLTSSTDLIKNEMPGDGKDEKVVKLLQAVEETKKHVQEGNMDKAQQVLEEAVKEAVVDSKSTITNEQITDLETGETRNDTPNDETQAPSEAPAQTPSN